MPGQAARTHDRAGSPDAQWVIHTRAWACHREQRSAAESACGSVGASRCLRGGQARMHPSSSRKANAWPPPTVSRSQLLESGKDDGFRSLVDDMVRFGAVLQM